MQINEKYRGRGLAKVFVALWLSLCLSAGVAARTGVIDKPILAHVLGSLGIISTSALCKLKIPPGNQGGS